MKIYNYLALIGFFYSLISNKIFAEHQKNTCNCHLEFSYFNSRYKNAWVGICTEKEHPDTYPYYLKSASIKSMVVYKPDKYSDCYFNLEMFNESLVNYMNMKMNHQEKYPN